MNNYYSELGTMVLRIEELRATQRYQNKILKRIAEALETIAREGSQ